MRPLLVALLAALFVVVLTAGPAGAQEEENRGSVDVGYEIGAYSGSAGDWPVAVVAVRGQLVEGDDFTVALTGDAGTIWTATVPYQSPVTRVEVDEFVAVGELTGVSISQAFEIITIIEIEDQPPEVEPDVAIAAEPPTPLPTPPEVVEQAGPPPLQPSDGLINQPVQVLGGGSGRSAGNLTVSVIVSFVVLVLAFRTPLPSASTQRWRT